MRVALGEGWLRGCCCCAGDAPWAKGVEAAYAAFALLDADDGFAGCDGVGVAITRNRNVNVVKAHSAVANAVAFGCAQSTLSREAGATQSQGKCFGSAIHGSHKYRQSISLVNQFWGTILRTRAR